MKQKFTNKGGATTQIQSKHNR